MANEVSGFLLRLTIECGEYFGLSREEQLALLPNPDICSKRWASLDWADYYPLVKKVLDRAGRDYELPEAARRFRRDCFGTRLDHYYWHFISWEKMCWITRNFILPRTLRGATLDYEKIARSSFHIRLSLSENMQSNRDIMLFFFGFMTTGSSQEKLEITVTDLSVSSHMAEFDVKYGRRSWYSALAFNPLRCYGQTRYELQRANADLVEQQRELARHTAMLEKAFLAVSNSVFVFQEGQIVRANRAARNFVEKGIVDLDQVARARKGKEFSGAVGRWFIVKDRREISVDANPAVMVTMRETTRERNLVEQRRLSESATREETMEELRERLGNNLAALGRKIAGVRETFPDRKPELDRLEEMVSMVRRDADGCVEASEGRIHSQDQFSSALKRLQDDFRDSFGFTVELHENGYPQFARSSDWGELFLILQECLRNAWRHSGSDRADVILSENRIEVRDGGTGLSPDSSTETGIGLKSIRSRSEKIGFESATLPSPQNGWLFTRSGSLEE